MFICKNYSQISIEDLLPKNICSSCHGILLSFNSLYKLSHENEKKLLETFDSISQEKSRENEDVEDDLADAVKEIGLRLDDGNNLRSNFGGNKGDDDDCSDKSSLEIPGSLETVLAKDIDRILAMTQLDDIPGPNHTCEFCNPQPPFATLHELNEHLKSVHINLVFHCESCDNFIDRNSLIQHMLCHLKEREVGDSVVEELKDLEGGETLAKLQKKTKEKTTTVGVEEVDENEVKTSRKVMKKESGANVKFLKKCHYCPKLFSNRSGRLYHQEQTHFKRRRFQCDMCESNFGLKQTLMNHIRNKHSNNERNFQCDFPGCDKTYKTKSALHNHRIYHNDEKWHCNYCSKKFHFNFLLQQHETTHLGVKEGKTFDCEICDKKFNTRNKLTKHKGIHDSNQYSCSKEGCTFKGNLKRYLIAHMKRMHTT